MDLLLDTNVLLPLAEEDDAVLPQAMREAMRDHENNLFVSTASLWEMAIKHRLGKLPLPCPIDE
jgi:PIN domain nuclease of toxin-antitoxin system